VINVILVILTINIWLKINKVVYHHVHQVKNTYYLFQIIMDFFIIKIKINMQIHQIQQILHAIFVVSLQIV